MYSLRRSEEQGRCFRTAHCGQLTSTIDRGQTDTVTC